MKSAIKTFDDACKALKIDTAALPVVAALPAKHQPAFIAHYKLIIIAQALNDGWEPDWSNWDEYKYYPWFELNESGSAFSFVVCGYDGTGTYVGSRLCFKSRELAKYAGKQFEALYNEYFFIAKQ